MLSDINKMLLLHCINNRHTDKCVALATTKWTLQLKIDYNYYNVSNEMRSEEIIRKSQAIFIGVLILSENCLLCCVSMVGSARLKVYYRSVSIHLNIMFRNNVPAHRFRKCCNHNKQWSAVAVAHTAIAFWN